MSLNLQEFRGNVSPVGWKVPSDLTTQEWEKIGKSVSKTSEVVSWFIGDWINAYPGERGSMYDEAVSLTGLSKRHLQDLKYICASIKISDRSEYLTIKHHYYVAKFRGNSSEQVKWLKLAEENKWSVRDLRREISGNKPSDNIHFSSDIPDWYTPNHISEMVDNFFGVIDLDPCTDNNCRILAENYYTENENGLKQPWDGRVYVNPPYGREIVNWVKKAIYEYKAGNSLEIIILVPARTDTEWFRLLRNYLKCFLYGRITFEGAINAAPFPSMIVYLGNRQSEFVEIFKKIGDIYQLNERCK